MFRWAAALFLLPLVWSSFRQLVLLTWAIGTQGFKVWGFYCAGAVFYLLIERWVHRPMWVYVFGHELTHAVSGMLMGAKVHSFKASARGGEVRLSKSNGFIALSPYIFPVYSIVILIIFAFCKRFWQDQRMDYVFQFLIGGTLAFHLSLTWSALHKHQTDLKVLGFLLSGVLILLGNSLILSFLGVFLFVGAPKPIQHLKSIGSESFSIWKSGWEATRFEIGLILGEKK